MTSEELIARLVRAGHPVERIASLQRRFALWSIVAAAAVVISVMAIGPRPDLASRVADVSYAASALAIALLMLSAAGAALSLSIPNDARSQWTRVVPLAAGVLWTSVLGAVLVAAGPVVRQLTDEPAHPFCMLQILVVASVPAGWLWRNLRRAAPMEPAWTGVLTLAAALAAGAISAAITCPIDRAAHQVWWHLLPVLAVSAAGVWAGLAWLARMR